MNAQQLKNSILQEAIEGRLVPQDPNDEPASVLLDKIRKEKARLVKEGKLKKKDLEETPISEEGIPFHIPESWEWVRLKVLCNSFIVPQRDKPTKFDGDIPWCRIEDIEGKYLNGSKTNQLVTKELADNMNMHLCPKGTVICACSASIGNQAITTVDCYTNQTFIGIVCNSNALYNEYLYYFFMSQKQALKDLGKGTTISYISRKKFEDYLFPLPPLAEQKRIVAKIEELLPKVEEYGKAQESLDKLNEELPERLKKSILQEAIEGRLVPQDPNDEPASVLLDKIRKEKARLVKEGKLKKKDLEDTPIDKENYPYSIPDTWKWVRLEDITIYISRGKSPVYSEIEKYPIVAQKCNQWSGFSLEKAKFADPKTVDKYAEERLLRDGDLLWNSTGLGTLGRMAIYDSSVNEYGWAAADSHVTVIRSLPSFCEYKFLFYFFVSAQVQNVIEDKADGSTKQKELYQETVKKYEIPLPPLAEQKRIVEKIEQLMKEIDKLKK